MAKRPDPSEREQRRIAREYEARQALHARQIARRRRDNWLGIVIAVIVIALAIFAVWSYTAWGPGQPAPSPSPSATPTTTPSPTPTATASGEVPAPELAEARLWTGSLTVGGVELGIELDGALAPQATAVLVEAARSGWYDGKYCPRVTYYSTMQVLQCGTETPDSTASEADFRFGPIENAPEDDRYLAGTIAMARVAGDGSSMAHQFFIVTADSTIPSDAAGGYTVVGRVTSGLEALIADVTSQGAAGGSEDGSPVTPVQITAFTIQ